MSVVETNTGSPVQENEMAPNDDSSSPHSLAANYLSATVNPRTGSLALSVRSPQLPGIGSLNVDLSISYNQGGDNNGQSILGLPLQWTYGISYIINGHININGAQDFIIDPNYPSGMRYYQINDYKLTTYDFSSLPTFPYDNTQQYAYLLSSLKGNNQYFDANGRMIGVDDKHGNHILYYYNSAQNIYNCQLDHIIDTYGQTIQLTYPANSIQINFPTGGQNQLQFSYNIDPTTGQLSSYTDPMGYNTGFEFNGGQIRSDLLSTITSPNNLIKTYAYSTIFYKNQAGVLLQLDVVQSVTTSFENKQQVVSYNFNPIGNDQNFLGFPLYNTIASGDSLFESNDNNYRYGCTVDDGVFLTNYSYNSLHLLLEKSITTKDGQLPVSNNINWYAGQLGDGTFPPFTELASNYQSIVAQDIQYFNTNGDSRSAKIETTYNNSLQVTSIKEYELASDGTGFLLSQENQSSYDVRYGMLLVKTNLDYKSTGVITTTPVITTTINVLTPDGKEVYMSQLGQGPFTPMHRTFEPEKVNTFSYDNHGRVLSKVLSWGTAAKSKPGIANYSYSNTYSYDAQKKQITITRIDSEGHPGVHVIDTTSGFLISKTNAVGNTVQYTYNNRGAQLTRLDPNGVLTKWTYDIPNNKITKHLVNGYKTHSYYDGFGNIIRKSDNGGTNGKERTLESRSYDLANRLQTKAGVLGQNSMITYVYNQQGLLYTETDALGNVSRYDYDPAKLIKTTYFNDIKTLEEFYNSDRKINLSHGYSSSDADTTVKESLYDNNRSKVYCQYGNQTTGDNWTGKSLGFNVSKKIVTSQTVGWDGVVRARQYSRDLFNKVVQCATQLKTPHQPDTSAITSLLQNNYAGLLEEEQNPIGQVRRYEYDAAGNMLRLVHFDGSYIRYTYYPNNKVHKKFYTDSDGSLQEITHTYHEGTNLIRSISSNRDGILSYEYTIDGQLQCLTYPDGRQMIWAYNADKNQLHTFTDATGQVTTYHYTVNGSLHQVVSQGITITYDYYDLISGKSCSGQLRSVTYSNGMGIAYTYDGFNHLETTTVTNAAGQQLLLITYGYDKVSRMVTSISYSSAVITDDSANYTSQYAYNSIGKLLSETVLNKSGITISTSVYTYDAANNVLAKSVTRQSDTILTSYTYDADNKLSSFTENGVKRIPAYDINGNMQQDGFGNTYAYNRLNQLISFTDANGNKTNYTYYLNGLRRSKQVGTASPVYYYYDASNSPNIVNEIQDSTLVSYLVGDRRYVRFVQNTSSTTTQFIIQGRKDVLFLVNNDGATQSMYNYDAYGQRRSLSGDVPVESFSINENPFRYCGEYHDSESRLYYLRSRYYSPRIMRFINRDSIQIGNHYSYVNGNPVMGTDPNGHSWWSWLLLGLSLVVTIAASIVSFGAASSAAVALDAAELGAMGGDAVATAGDTAAESAEAAGDTISGTGRFGADSDSELEGMDTGEDNIRDFNSNSTLPQSETNVLGYNHNCAQCAIGYLLGETATDVANSLGVEEGWMGTDQNVFRAFAARGLTQSDTFDFVTSDPREAFGFMRTSVPGSRFGFLYNSGDGIGHTIVAELSEDGELTYVDPQANTRFAETPTGWSNDMNPQSYRIIRVYYPEPMDLGSDSEDLAFAQANNNNYVDPWGAPNGNSNW